MAKRNKVRWTGGRIRSLRQHLRMTQQELSDELGIRQQTVSEWERALYLPRGSSATLLTIVAERSGFDYGAIDDSAT